MKVSPINQSNNTVKRTRRPSAATRGAATIAGFLGTSTAASWLIKPNAMSEVVKECGGMKNYVKQYLIGIAALSLLGGTTAAVFSKVGDKFIHKKSPKAVN